MNGLSQRSARISEWNTLAEWFLSTEPPAEPFALYPHLYISHPARWWQALRGDIATGPGKARDHYGAVRRDLQRLADLLGGPDARALREGGDDG